MKKFVFADMGVQVLVKTHFQGQTMEILAYLAHLHQCKISITAFLVLLSLVNGRGGLKCCCCVVSQFGYVGGLG